MEWFSLAAKIGSWLIGCILVMAAIGYIYQKIAAALDNRTPPGMLLSVDGRQLHLLCMGEASGPSIVLEAGGSNSSITSRAIQTEIAKFAHVCSYDRAGFGYSDAVDRGRTFDDIAQDLNEILTAAEIPQPYILVGESMGGLMVRNYYRHHPEKIAGVVLLDAAEEEHTFSRLDKLREMRSRASITSWFARLGVVRFVLNLAPEKLGIPAGLSSSRRREIVAEYSRPGFFDATALELEAYFSTPEHQRAPEGFGLLGATPLVVITHGKPLKGTQAFLEEGWAEAQERLGALSTNSKILVAEKSGHAISLDQPKLVVDTIQSLLAELTASDSK